MRSYAGRGVGAHFLEDMLLAERYVYVVSRWISPEYADRLIERAREGVAVRIITSNDPEKHHQEALKRLRKALRPGKLLLLRRRDWEPPNMELGIVEQRYLHVKMYVYDDKLAVVGSANLTQHGMWSNIEHIVVFDQPEEIEAIKRDFEKLWKLYTESKETAVEVTTLEDIAKALGKPLAELASIFKRKLRKQP